MGGGSSSPQRSNRAENPRRDNTRAVPHPSVTGRPGGPGRPAPPGQPGRPYAHGQTMGARPYPRGMYTQQPLVNLGPSGRGPPGYGHQRSMLPPTQVQNVTTLKNEVNLIKDSISMRQIDSGYYEIQFSVDSTYDCTIGVFYTASEVHTPEKGLQIHSAMTPVGITLGPGMKQKMPDERFIFKLKDFHQESLFKFTPTFFPLIIRMDTVYPRTAEFANKAMGIITYCVFKMGEGNALCVRVIKQKLLFNGKVFELHDVYGIEHEEAEENEQLSNKECIICMTNLRDTLVLPCRHLCLCFECANTVRANGSPCPICRTKVSSFVNIKLTDQLFGSKGDISIYSAIYTKDWEEHMEFGEINEYIKEFLKFNGYKSTLDCMEAEERTKIVTSKATKKTINIIPKDIGEKGVPRLYGFFEQDKGKSSRERKLENELKALTKKHNAVLQSARQIFSIAINCLQQLHNIKDGNSMGENLGETIDNYKIQLGKYHKILLSDGADRSELFSEAVMIEHKNKLIKAKEENNLENIIEVLLSLRVNALQISPELRKNLVYELIRNDIFQISSKKNNKFIEDLLSINSHALRHAICALVSVIVSTYKGVEYITQVDLTVLQKIIDILKEQEDGSVTQRFCIGILQKMSIKEDLIQIMMKNKLLDWIIKLIERATLNEIHTFSLDFASALMANMLHAPSTLEYLEKNPTYTKSIMDRLLVLIRETIPTSVLMHLLICLSYLSKERFSGQVEECMFVDKISDFVEYYSQVNISGGVDNENDEIDKRTVLDLCAHMFHPKDVTQDISQTMEYNDMKCEDRIKEFENEQGDLIFECFPDEVKRLIAKSSCRMFNYNSADKRIKTYQVKTKKERAFQKWKRDVNTLERPKMIDNYRKRIEKFVFEMVDKPILLKAQHPKYIEKENSSSFLGPSKMVIRGFKSERQRVEDAIVSNKQLDTRGVIGNVTTHDFRPRDRSKEIQKDMRFTAKTALERVATQVKESIISQQTAAPKKAKKDPFLDDDDVPSQNLDNSGVSLKAMANPEANVALARTLRADLHLKTHFQAATAMAMQIGSLRQPTYSKNDTKVIYDLEDTFQRLREKQLQLDIEDHLNDIIANNKAISNEDMELANEFIRRKTLIESPEITFENKIRLDMTKADEFYTASPLLAKKKSEKLLHEQSAQGGGRTVNTTQLINELMALSVQTQKRSTHKGSTLFSSAISPRKGLFLAPINLGEYNLNRLEKMATEGLPPIGNILGKTTSSKGFRKHPLLSRGSLDPKHVTFTSQFPFSATSKQTKHKPFVPSTGDDIDPKLNSALLAKEICVLCKYDNMKNDASEKVLLKGGGKLVAGGASDLSNKQLYDTLSYSRSFYGVDPKNKMKVVKSKIRGYIMGKPKHKKKADTAILEELDNDIYDTL